MRKIINNICCEFSSCYLQDENKEEETLFLKVHPVDIYDLSEVLYDYGFILESSDVVTEPYALAIYIRKKTDHVSSY